MNNKHSSRGNLEDKSLFIIADKKPKLGLIIGQKGGRDSTRATWITRAWKLDKVWKIRSVMFADKEETAFLGPQAS